MSQFVNDTFSGASANITARAGETGATWTRRVGSVDAILDGSGILTPQAAALFYASGAPAGTDYKSSILQTYQGGSLYYGGYTAACNRIDTSDASGSFYAFGWDFQGDGNTGQWRMYRVVAGAWTELGTPSSNSANGGDVEFQVTGAGATVTLTGIVGGVTKVSATDTSGSRLTAAGKAGIWTNTNNAGQGTFIDQFRADDVTVGPSAFISAFAMGANGIYTPR